MISLTWNAPIETFTREGDFFEGKGVDAFYCSTYGFLITSLHKNVGNRVKPMNSLSLWKCVYKEDYQAHLEKCVRLIAKYQFRR